MSLDVTPEQLRRDPIAFADTVLKLNEKGEPWTLSRHQRRVLARFLRRDSAGRLMFRHLLWGEPKKSGKTLLAALAVLWWGFVTPSTEILIVANDLDQAVGRVFRTAAALVHHNRALRDYVTVRAEELLFSNRTIAPAIAGDYRGAAGSRHSFYSLDEPWAITQERAERLIEEITLPATEANAWALWTTTAGIVGESMVLQRPYERGLAGTRVDDELEMYEADELAMFWSHTPRMPWQVGAEGEKYYAEQRRSLRPGTFARLHRNEWVSAESTAIEAATWDACVYPEHAPLLPTQEPFVVFALDAAPKHDSTAVVGVARDEDLIVLVQHRIWTPKGAPLDFAVIEEHLRWLHAHYRARFVADPYQLHSTIMRGQQDGLAIEEYPQTSANLTRAAETLLELLRSQRLALYADDELRAQAMNATIAESPRGIRLTKPTAGRKVDAIVALAMACAVCVEMPVSVPVHIW